MAKDPQAAEASARDEPLPVALRVPLALVGAGLGLGTAGLAILAVFVLLAELVGTIDGALLNVLFLLSMPLSLALGAVVGRRVYVGQLSRVQGALTAAPALPSRAIAGKGSTLAVAAPPSSSRRRRP